MRICKMFLSILLIATAVLSAAAPGPIGGKKIRVALFLDRGANPRDILRESLEAAPDISLTVVDGEDLREGWLRDFDLLIVPGGSAKRESMSMKEEGRKEVRDFVGRGGLYIGICAGCYLLTEAKPTDLGLLPLDTVDKPHWQRGKGVLPIELTPMGNEIFGTKERIIEVLYHNGPVVDASHVTPASDFIPLGYYRSELVERGGKRGLMNGAPAMFFGRFGKGLVIGISPHPEANIHQVYMEMNAIRWLYAHRNPL